ncbi:MAG TPA: ABC transporter ATP-binding protein [Acidimicrobiales bacterium]|nr:ABC transporter ATP-binding protein [Acidimicrobiales bacterium]
MLRAERLTRSFGGRRAVSDVSFQVPPGEVVGFLGPNGAGKTTTMRMLVGLLDPDRGRAHAPERLGFLPEVFAGYDALTAGGYLGFMSRMKGTTRAEVARCLDASGAADLARRPIGRLSKGQRQRIGLAQALLGSPPAYVLDEPMQGFDPAQAVEARELIKGLAAQGAAVLVSTHLLAEAAAICDRVVVIVRGKVVAEERPGEVADLEARFLRLVGERELK